MISKDLVVTNGANTTFHKINKITSHPPFVMATLEVKSYATESAYLEGQSNTWNQNIEMPISNLSSTLFETAEDWLTTSPDSPLTGGAIVQDQMVTLENARDRSWNRIKLIREAKELEPFSYNGYVYDADKVKITGAALGAHMSVSAGIPYEIEFTLADNTTITLDGPGMMSVGIALLQHIDAVHQIGRGLRDQLYAVECDSFEKIAAIQWPLS